MMGTKWVFRNQLDESGVVVRNKDRLVAKGYNQYEGIEFEEIFVSLARLEAIYILIAFVSHMGIKLFQMNVKCAFLNDFQNEKVYVKRPCNLENSKFSNHGFKFHKAPYGLKQV